MECNEKLTLWEEDGQGVSVRVPYKLTSMVIHSGNYSGGHYTTQGIEESSGEIFLCNDISVSKIEKFNMRDVYMAVYRRL